MGKKRTDKRVSPLDSMTNQSSPQTDDQPPPIHQLLKGLPELKTLDLANQSSKPSIIGRSSSDGTLIFIPTFCSGSKVSDKGASVTPESWGGETPISKVYPDSQMEKRIDSSSNSPKPLIERIGERKKTLAERIGEKRKGDWIEERDGTEGRKEKRRLIDRLGIMKENTHLDDLTSRENSGHGKLEEERPSSTPPTNGLLSRLSSFSTRTSPSPSDESSPPRDHRSISPSPSGETSSVDEPSTYTESSPTSSYRDLCQRMWHAWQELKSEPQGEKGANESSPAQIGSSPGERLLKRPLSHSPTAETNSINIPTIYSKNFGGKTSTTIPVLSSSMKPFGKQSEVERTVPYVTPACVKISPKASFNPMESSISRCNVEETEGSAITSTARQAVRTTPASISTNVANAKKKTTDNQLVEKEEVEAIGLKPKYMRYNRWNIEGRPFPGVVDWSKGALPLPRPPVMPSEHAVMRTIREHSELFKITTPINVPLFRELLRKHPNPLFVKSVCDGLVEGFWPWASSDLPDYPITNDQARTEPQDEEKLAFLTEQKDHEVHMGRFSDVFRGELLPGMYCMPVFAVPKTEPGSFRLVTHQSFGKHSLNSMTPPHDHAFPMDGLARLGDQLLRLRRDLGDQEDLVVWKSDIAEAYRLLPMAFQWQIKQINTIDNVRHVDRCLAFGGKRSGDIYISFMSLVLWIAENKRKVSHPNGFIDDTFAAQKASSMIFHRKLDRLIPSDQAKMLDLWDDLGIPYKLRKQSHGRFLTILGIEVNALELTFTLPQDKLLELVGEMNRFIFIHPQRSPRRRLKELQVLAGWMNWSFNVFPLLKPALSNVYHKLRSLSDTKKRVTISRAISNDLLWARRYISSSSGVHLLQATDWDLSTSHVTIFTDACLTGMGFYIPATKEGFWSDVPSHVPSEWIFYREKWAVLAAIDHAITHLGMVKQRIVIYTDNTNTVDVYNTLHALPLYNQLLQLAVDLLI